ncbi:hypothetical protein FHG87_015921 [Trinorchestia longiramus]|nr:hypothetical protein FHG87_015921 [Trinorchestia longiramus]
MSSSPEAIQAYLNHLKKTTSRAEAASPGEDFIDHFLENEVNSNDLPSSLVKSSSAKKPLKSPIKSSKLGDNLRKYENKYVNREVKKIIHKSSVARVSEESDEECTDNRSSSSDKSVLDSQLEKWLEESSLNDSSPNTSRILRVRKSGLKNVLSAESLLQKSSAYSSPVKERLSRENLFSASNRRRAFVASRGENNGRASNGRNSQSLSFEHPDLRSGPREGDQTISTTPDRSIGCLLKRASKNNIFRSSSLQDDYSTTEEHLSRRISRRDSYVYRDGVGLVSASSTSNETIQTDDEISEEIEELSLKVLTHSQSKTESQSKEKLLVASQVKSQEKLDNYVGQTKLAQVSSKHAFRGDRTEKKCLKMKNRSPDNKISVFNSANYSSTFESDSAGETLSRSDVKNVTELNSTIDELNGSNKTQRSSVLELNSTSSSSSINHMTSSTSISMKNTSSGISCNHTHGNYKRQSKKKHKRRSNSYNECSKCDHLMRHARKKKKRHRRKSCSNACSSSSSSSSSSYSSDSTVTSRRRARSCRKCRRRQRKECKNCKRLQDLLLWSTSIDRLWGPGHQYDLPVVAAGFGAANNQASLAKVKCVEDAMRETISLGQKFIATQRSTYGAYCAAIQSTYRYTTTHQLNEVFLPATTSQN